MITPIFWHHKSVIPKLLLPLSWLYGIGRKLHVALSTPQTTDLPTICIGNIVAGGSGKTPTCQAVAEMLKASGYNPHIISRGYGGNINVSTRVRPDHSHAEVGDEAFLHAKHFPCWVGADRLKTIEAAKNSGADIIVMDDGLQNPHIKPDISILVVDGDYGFGNGMLLPAGPLRETISAASKRIDSVLVIGEDKHNISRIFSKKPIFAAEIEATDNNVRGKKLFAFAGIGRPEKFYNTLKNLSADVVTTRNFPDHHQYSQQEISEVITQAKSSNLLAITTEKDHARLPENMKKNIAFLPVRLHIKDSHKLGEWIKNSL